MGKRESMYAGSEDDLKRDNILARSLELLTNLPPSPLKDDLLAVCKEYVNI